MIRNANVLNKCISSIICLNMEIPTHARLYGIALYCIGNEIQRLKATKQYHLEQNYDIDSFMYFSPSLLRNLVRLPNHHFDRVADQLIKTTETITQKLHEVSKDERRVMELAENNSKIERKLTKCITRYFNALRPLLRDKEDVDREFTELQETYEQWKRGKAVLNESAAILANLKFMKNVDELKE